MLANKKWLPEEEKEPQRKPNFPKGESHIPFFFGAFIGGGLFGIIIVCALILLFNEPVGTMLALADMKVK